MTRRERRRAERARRAARTALLDQADAAGTEAAGILADLADRAGEPLRQHAPGPVLAALVQDMCTRLALRVLAGEATTCEHVTGRSPQPVFWHPWDDALRCAACVPAALDRIRGTPEDTTCDHCRAACERVHAAILALPAYVVDVPGGPLSALPPIIFAAHLCDDCWRAELPDVPLRPRAAS